MARGIDTTDTLYKRGYGDGRERRPSLLQNWGGYHARLYAEGYLAGQAQTDSDEIAIAGPEPAKGCAGCSHREVGGYCLKDPSHSTCTGNTSRPEPKNAPEDPAVCGRCAWQGREGTFEGDDAFDHCVDCGYTLAIRARDGRGPTGFEERRS